MFDTMFNDLFIESAFGSFGEEGCTLTTDSNGFTSAEVDIDESYVIDGDPFAFITEAMYQNVVNANNINLAIMADRYAYLKENGIELTSVQEAAEGEKTGIIAKIKAFFNAVKEKIKKFFETVLQKMKDLQEKIKNKFFKKQVNKKIATATAAKAAENLTSVEIEVPAYMPDNVYMWAQKQFDRIIDGDNPEAFPFTSKKTKTTIGKERTVLGSYGKFIDAVKKLENNALKTLERMEMATVKGLGDSNDDKALKKDVKTSYAAWANSVVSLSKEATGHIMTRVNAAMGAMYKAGVKESASYMDNLEMI